MKFSTQEEYGLRCLLQIARRDKGASMTIPEISHAEGLTIAHVAKLMRLLRLGGFVESARGQAGGYMLARSSDTIIVGDVLAVLGGRLLKEDFCNTFTVSENLCTHLTVDCSVFSLWKLVQNEIDKVLKNTTLMDLVLKVPHSHDVRLLNISLPQQLPLESISD